MTAAVTTGGTVDLVEKVTLGQLWRRRGSRRRARHGPRAGDGRCPPGTPGRLGEGRETGSEGCEDRTPQGPGAAGHRQDFGLRSVRNEGPLEGPERGRGTRDVRV